MYALQSFTVETVPGHPDHVHRGALRDSASATFLAAPASFWQSSPLTYAQAGGCGSIVGYMLNRPAGP